MEKIGEGESAEVFKIQDEKVLKLFKEDEYHKDSFNLEYNIAKYMGSKTNLAPKVYEKRVVDSRNGYTMDEVEGELLQCIIDNNRDSLLIYAIEMGKSHRLLHNEPIDELSSLPKCSVFVEKMLQKQSVFSKEITNWLIELLRNLPGPESLLHGDLMPYNIISNNTDMYIIDWAEPSKGPALLDIARTINYIKDTTDYPNSIITKESKMFIKHYLDGYGLEIDKDGLHEAFLINAACEVLWAEYRKQEDDYSNYLREFIEKNYIAENYEYIEELS